MYKIKDYSYKKARELSLDIKPSKKAGKKIDVYKKGDYITSIGDNRYKDYPTYVLENGKTFVMREKDYIILVIKKMHVKHLRGGLASKLLW
jgi:hypothetical protein